MTKPVTIIILLSAMITLLSMISRQQHILPILLCLEGLILLIICYLLSSSGNCLIYTNPLIIVILTIRVSGARIGLTILVMIRRKTGNDSITRPTLFIC